MRIQIWLIAESVVKRPALRAHCVAGIRVGIAALTIALLSFAQTIRGVHAAPGDLDPSFGSNGKVVTDVSPNGAGAKAVAVQADGKIVAAGGFAQPPFLNGGIALVRYNTDGSLDPNFGQDGQVLTQLSTLTGSTASGASAEALAISIQGDGKIVVAGGTAQDGATSFIVARYNSDGTLDQNFAAGGIVTTPGGNEFTSLAIQPDGKIVAAGTTPFGTTPTGTRADWFTLARYNADGSTDKSFGSAGLTSFAVLDTDDIPQILVQPDGKILLGGTALSFPPGSGSLTTEFALARVNPDGTLDSSFGEGGKVITGFNESVDDGLRAITSGPDGKIVAAGATRFQDSTHPAALALAHYNSDGSLDTGFGQQGKLLSPTSNSYDTSSIAFKQTGKIVVAGGYDAGKGLVFVLSGFNADGSPDTGFGQNGVINTSFGSKSDDIADAMAIQPDGAVVVAGSTDNDNVHYRFAIARYDGDPGFAITLPQPAINMDSGTNTRVRININRTGGLSGIVTVTPSDTSAFNIKVKPGAVSTSDSVASFKIKALANATPGPHQIVFTGTDSSGTMHTSTLTVTIN